MPTKLSISRAVHTCLQLYADAIEPFKEDLRAEVKVGLFQERIVVVTHVRTKDGAYSSLNPIFNAEMIVDRKCERLGISSFRFEVFDLAVDRSRPHFPGFETLDEVLES